MFHHTLLSEWTKLRTTASFWWTTGLVLLVSIGWAGLLATFTPDGPGAFMTPDLAHSGFLVFGVPVIMIQAIMVVTTEYRYGLPAANFLATPRRWQVALAKVVLYAVIAALLTLVCLTTSYWLSDLLAPASVSEWYRPFETDAARRYLWAYPTFMAVLVVFCQGLGLLLRQTAGTVALALIWYLGLEQAVRLIPRVGERILRYLPFENLNAVLVNMPVRGTEWDVWVSALIFLAWAVVAWVAGVVVLQRRDA
ncbi:multidrug ABC transporter permease [Corynebacterium guangdongense]|uniref:ABC-2 type transport system permease protein n=1 Tax=Corynebacterium guangdongense TaxID=1783348 RepID=A0ABU1ZZL7_9CORY|nr:multidrug ABC transporter permease [Corynebacterium guangdongense]MDR7330341.1 ABC-2 type transport system permease protein [Corynebacterium guangdongense]WJZ18899.1 ABC-2 family transporter protein [Corynebacterium guangdongense]